MSRPERHISNQQIALVHVWKREMGLDDATYREMLRNVAGCESARFMSQAGFDRLRRHVSQRGVRVPPRLAVEPWEPTPKQLGMIRHLAEELGLGNLRGVIGRATQDRAHEIEEMTRTDASAVIDALCAMRERRSHGRCA